jgi:hypothetical protein
LRKIKEIKKQLLLFTLAVVVLCNNARPAALARNDRAAQALQQPARRVKFGGVRQLKAAFQSDSGKVRLVALVSPT